MPTGVANFDQRQSEVGDLHVVLVAGSSKPMPRTQGEPSHPKPTERVACDLLPPVAWQGKPLMDTSERDCKVGGITFRRKAKIVGVCRRSRIPAGDQRQIVVACDRAEGTGKFACIALGRETEIVQIHPPATA
jgi:hypothetical protein